VVFAYIVLKMADRGEINLDTPVYKYTNIDRFENKEWAKLVTPRMVLSHRAGLSNWAAGVSTDAWPTAVIKFKYPPDSTFSYSGEAYAFLQRAVEDIRGKSIQEVAEEEVFTPFGMPNTSYGWKENYEVKATDEYNRRGENVGKQIYPRENVGYTLRTTANEYVRFIQNAIVEGKGLKPETHRLMLTPTGIAHRNEEAKEYDKYIEWGLGIGIEHNEELGDIYHHWGDNGNFKALFIIVPSKNKYLVYFTNSQNGHDIIDQLTPLFFGNAKPLHLSAWIKNR
jgi:CubicO group peptidase (beta-lactamase class C family)